MFVCWFGVPPSICLFLLLPCGLCPVVNVSCVVWTCTNHPVCSPAGTATTIYSCSFEVYTIFFFFQRRAFQRAVAYLTLLNLDAFQVSKLERRAWPLWCTCLFVERKSCFFVFLRNINSTLVLF